MSLGSDPCRGWRGRPSEDARILRLMTADADSPRFATVVYDDAEAAKRRAAILRRTVLLRDWPIYVAQRGRTVTMFRAEDDAYDV